MTKVDVNNAEALAQAGLYGEHDILTGKILIRRIGGSLGRNFEGETYAQQE